MKLVIVQSSNDLLSLEKMLSPSTDVLAFNQNVMVALNERGVEYKTIEDFYTSEQYCADNITYSEELEGLMLQLDTACESAVNLPCAYSGNAIYFLTWFDDLLYLEKLIQAIQNKYKKIYLYAVHEPKRQMESELSFFQLNSYKVNGTISFPQERLAERIVQLIYNSIDIEFVEDMPLGQRNIGLLAQVRHFLNKVKGYVGREVSSRKYTKSRDLEHESQKVYVIQDGYDAVYLRKYLPKFEYLNPVTRLRQDVALEQPESLPRDLINQVMESFVKKYFFFLDEYIYLLINSYYVEIVGRMRYFRGGFNALVKEDKPNFLLLSIGVRDVFDFICCHVANYHNIPVVIFQHGGASIFHYSSYQKYMEYNEKIDNVLIAQSRKELYKTQNTATRSIYFGSIQQYEIDSQPHTKESNKDVVFFLGPDMDFSFRHLLNYYSLNKKHRQSVDVIKMAKKASVHMDIKLHPSGEKSSYRCYQDIIANEQGVDIDILYGVSAESIIEAYKLIIIDFLPSAIVKHVFSARSPVIIFDYDFDKIRVNDDVLSDLYKRCYIAKNANELYTLLKKFKSGNLPAKWSESFVDEYVYPVKEGSPGKNIAEYINKLITR